MSRTTNHSESIIEQAKIAANLANTAEELRQAQAILLSALFGATISQAAVAMGVGSATVSRLRASFRQAQTQEASGSASKANWGGRRHCWMSFDEEKEFLEPWLAKAEKGSLVVASPIREALAQRLGQPVKASVVYRMLARHDWRKVAPDTRHPKSDPAVQEAWKKNFRKNWQPCSSRKLPKDAK